MSGRRLPALLLLLAQGCDGHESPPPTPAPAVQPEAPAAEVPTPPDPLPLADPQTEAAPATDAPLAVAEAPRADGPPEDFGHIQPPEPPPDPGALTVHALAGYEVVAVYSLPDLTSPRLGYLRIGARTMVTAKIDDRGTGCDKGFHALAVGGYACASKGLIVDPDKPPYMYKPPPPPRIDAPIPYDYGVVAQDGTPMWWRIPDAEEVTLAAQKYRAIVAAEQPAPETPARPDAAKPDAARPDAKPDPAKPDADAPPPAPDAPPPAAPDVPAAPAPAADAAPPDAAPPDAAPPPPLTEEEKAAIARREAAARKRAAAREKQRQEEERALARKRARLPLNSQTPFMEHGFVVTLGDKIREGGQSWWKTTRGGFVQASRTYRKETRDFHGGELPREATVAFGFIEPERAAAAIRDPGGALKFKRRLEHRQLLAFTAEVEVGGRPYLVTHDGLHVRRGDLRMAVLAPRPAEVDPWERWIDVDLERQILVAYEGDTPVYATLVSSGKKGTAEESFATPRGKFRIGGKHISSSMDGDTASDGRYSIQDVPWAMFFHGNYALHGAFWHSKFGARRSHGCVNLGPTDARWLFYWTTPFVPDGWHGVNAHAGAPGSMVVIH